jgi:hypothetical protein
MTSFVVGTADFRAALQAVAPHAFPDPELSMIHRVRLNVGSDLTVTATNRYTAAAALVSIEENIDGQLDAVDLAPPDVKEILSLFKVKREDEVTQLRVEADGKHVRVTDCAGLFDGKSYRLPRRPSEEQFPDIPRLISAVIAGHIDVPERLVVDGGFVRQFVAAAFAYQQPLTVEPTGDRKALVIACGESFIGMLMPMSGDPDELDGWRRAWKRRLPVVSAEQADQVAVAVRAQLHDMAQEITEHDQEPESEEDE